MAVGSFYQVILKGLYGSVNTRNEFWYRQQSGTGDATELNTFFQTYVMSSIKLIVSSDTGFNGVSVYNHNDDADFQEDTFALEPGDWAGATMPPMNATGFSTPRKRLGMRPGQKRFLGAPINAVSNGVFTNASFLTAADTCAVGLSSPITDGGTGSVWYPIIVKRVNVGTSLNPDYRVPVTITTSDYYEADDWSLKVNVTTQNSRKFGVGI